MAKSTGMMACVRARSAARPAAALATAPSATRGEPCGYPSRPAKNGAQKTVPNSRDALKSSERLRRIAMCRTRARQRTSRMASCSVAPSMTCASAISRRSCACSRAWASSAARNPCWAPPERWRAVQSAERLLSVTRCACSLWVVSSASSVADQSSAAADAAATRSPSGSSPTARTARRLASLTAARNVAQRSALKKTSSAGLASAGASAGTSLCATSATASRKMPSLASSAPGTPAL
mmetsp:Transcript_35573/g.109687  ORF Transcript_35573/g.109687 Transcript_35573/m.109687 type:complete len:238 (-) Transcript_35573:1216-1929(-)